ncbi:hypothetical protein ATCC90586_004561 [Pythium insidiosum]|nr:hypothetical protein ATCC90586_004561 [Pythium insidiosum]
MPVQDAPTKPTVAPQQAQPVKILFLDGLRGLAAFFVVVQHSHWYDRNFGAYGVDMFFVLSAFLLTMLFDKKVGQLLERRARLHSWGFALADYFSRRFLRVYPLFFAVAVILWILPLKAVQQYWVDIEAGEFDFFKVITFSFDYRYHVFWTLPVEIGYYFVIPAIVIVLALLRKWWWIPVLPMIYWVIHEGFTTYRPDHTPLRPHLNTFVAGSLGAIVYNRIAACILKHTFVFQWYHKIVLRMIEYVALAFLVSVIYGGVWFNWLHWDPLPDSPSTFLSGYLVIVIVCEILLPGPFGRMLEWNVLMFFGKISYSMYLLHSFVIYSDWVSSQKSYDQNFATVGLVCLLSSASYYTIEYPLQRLAGRISKYLKEPRVVVPVAALVVSVSTLVTCVIIAKTSNVYLSGLYWPFFSYTGRDKPAYYVFCTGLTITALLMIATWAFNFQFQHAALVKAQQSGADVKRHLKMATITRFAGVISVFGLSLLAFFDTGKWPLTHQLAAYWFFGWEVVATIMNTFVSKRIFDLAKTSEATSASSYIILEAGAPKSTAQKLETRVQKRGWTFRIQRALNIVFFVAFLLYIPYNIISPSNCPKLTVQECLDRNLGERYCQVTMRHNEVETKLPNCTDDIVRVQIRALAQLTCVLTMIGYCVTFIKHDYEDVETEHDAVEVTPTTQQQ